MARHRVHICDVPGVNDAASTWGTSHCLEVEVEISGDRAHYTVIIPEMAMACIPESTVAWIRQRVGANIDRMRVQETAEARAKELFVRMLTDEQRRTLETARFIQVTGSAGGNYLIHCGQSYSGNVVRMKRNGERGPSFCGYPSYTRPAGVSGMPRHDMFLGQLLLIQTDEKRFLDVAVRYGG